MVWVNLSLVALLTIVAVVAGDGLPGCGGFIVSDVDIDFSLIKVPKGERK